MAGGEDAFMLETAVECVVYFWGEGCVEENDDDDTSKSRRLGSLLTVDRETERNSEDDEGTEDRIVWIGDGDEDVNETNE